MRRITRRDFLKLAGLGLGALAFHDADDVALAGRSLGRVTEDGVRVLTRPHPDGVTVRQVNRDEVLITLREVVGEGLRPHNHVYFETNEGYVWSAQLQPVEFRLNPPHPISPEAGVWAEVSVPFTDGRRQPRPEARVVYRLYYSAVFPIVGWHTGKDGAVWYFIQDENGVRMYAPAAHLRVIPPEELTPISPDVAEKHIEVNLDTQLLTAYEAGAPVFRTRVASGKEWFGPDGLGTNPISTTPLGSYAIWSKRISRHMVGGTRESGYDLPGVGWVSLFSAEGAAIHSTYWHNDFGTPKSHGCLNVTPQAAKWLFRWTRPPVDYRPGVIIVTWPGGTRVNVEKGARRA